MLTLDNLKNVMKSIISQFNDENVTIDDNTIHQTVLSPDDGLQSGLDSKTLYQHGVQWVLNRYHHNIKPWPDDWMELSISQLAPQLL